MLGKVLGHPPCAETRDIGCVEELCRRVSYLSPPGAPERQLVFEDAREVVLAINVDNAVLIVETIHSPND